MVGGGYWGGGLFGGGGAYLRAAYWRIFIFQYICIQNVTSCAVISAHCTRSLCALGAVCAKQTQFFSALLKAANPF